MIRICSPQDKPDVTLRTFDDEGCPVQLPIKVRPHFSEFIKKVSRLYEVVVFTAAADYYATAIIEYLDPNRQFISEILTRRHCMCTKNGFNIKDLRIIRNRDLKNMIIVDNLVHSFGFQLDNGVPIMEFLGEQNDAELKHLVPYLYEAWKADDIRIFNRNRLQLSNMLTMTEETLFQF